MKEKPQDHKFQYPIVRELTPEEKLKIQQDAMRESKKRIKSDFKLPSDKSK